MRGEVDVPQYVVSHERLYQHAGLTPTVLELHLVALIAEYQQVAVHQSDQPVFIGKCMVDRSSRTIVGRAIISGRGQNPHDWVQVGYQRPGSEEDKLLIGNLKPSAGT